MIFKKTFFFLFSFSMFMFFLICFSLNYFVLFFNYFPFSIDYFSIQSFSFALDLNSITFLFMVSLVTSLVSLYSEVYMEHYNNKKFYYIMMFFLVSMIFLSISSSFLILMIGWDLLGFTSLCLIMFYPSKNTLYNSFMTLFFNRLGDVFLVVSFCLLILNPSNIYSMNSMIFPFFLFIIACSFTKSAQFPFSSWLPAAMSAPTPISAMVHSSTLVTAGLFLMYKFYYYIFFFNLNYFIMWISCMTFVLGGLMANLELDFKKIIAFSTMSQISMVIFFFSCFFLTISMFHMFLHAAFKTLLFCSAGIFFIFKYSDQLSNSFAFNDMLVNSFIFFSIFSMTGLIFSSSFFSKDLILEFFLCSSDYFLSFFLVFGSMMTLFYCGKLMKSTFSWINSSNLFFLFKSYKFLFILFFSFVCLFSGAWMKSLFFFGKFPLVYFSDVTFIFLLLSMFLLMSFFFNNKFLNFLTLDIFFMKVFTFSILSFFSNRKIISDISLSDHYFFKSYYFFFERFKFNNFFFSSFYFFMFMLIFYFFI